MMYISSTSPQKQCPVESSTTSSTSRDRYLSIRTARSASSPRLSSSRPSSVSPSGGTRSPGATTHHRHPLRSVERSMCENAAGKTTKTMTAGQSQALLERAGARSNPAAAATAPGATWRGSLRRKAFTQARPCPSTRRRARWRSSMLEDMYDDP